MFVINKLISSLFLVNNSLIIRENYSLEKINNDIISIPFLVTEHRRKLPLIHYCDISHNDIPRNTIV